MEQDRIEYLKRVIKRTYKRYTGERTDGEATLLDVAKFFNIPIDESRKEDYSIKKIDYNTPSIEIMDEKNNISYVATYTDKADLLNYWGAKEFNSVISTSPIRKEESLYYIESEIPIVTKLTFFDGEYELAFEREMPNSVGLFVNDGVKMTIRYLQNLEYDGRNVQQQLLAKIFTNKNNEEELDSTFEQEYTYSSNNYVIKKDSQDKYTYMINNNVIYGINEFEQENVCHYLNGICFENSNVDVSKFLPFHIKSDDPIFRLIMQRSIIIFKGGTDDAIHHTLTIFKIGDLENAEYKQNKSIYLNYEAIRWENFKDEKGMPQHKKVVVAHKEARYPRIDNGNITSLEIRNITEVLDTEFEDDTFIQIVINELKTFANKMDIQKGFVQEELDPLSPKLFIDKSFDEICALVSANKDDYFRLIREQFEAATNINKAKGKEQAMILKPDSVHEDKL